MSPPFRDEFMSETGFHPQDSGFLQTQAAQDAGETGYRDESAISNPLGYFNPAPSYDAVPQAFGEQPNGVDYALPSSVFNDFYQPNLAFGDCDWSLNTNVLALDNSIFSAVDKPQADFDDFLASIFAAETAPVHLDERLNRIPPSAIPTRLPSNREVSTHDQILPFRETTSFIGNAVDFNLAYASQGAHSSGLKHTRVTPPTVAQTGEGSSDQNYLGTIPQSRVTAPESGPQTHLQVAKRPIALSQQSKINRISKRAIYRFDPRAFSFCNAVGKFQSKDAPARKSYDTVRRREVAKMRDVGACFTCRMWKVTCRPVEGKEDEPCERCSSRFTEGSPLHKRSARADISWVTSTTVTLEVNLTTHYKSDPVKIECRHFKPHEDDVVLKFIGTQGGPIQVPSYAAVDAEVYKDQLPQITQSLRKVFLEEKIDKGCSEAMVRSLRAAFHYADHHPDSIVNTALGIWVGSKLCGTEKSLVGAELLGISVVQEPGQLLDRLIPAPPKIDHQLDSMVIEWMCENATALMRSLARKLIAKKRKDWFEVFLTMLILTNNIEYVYGMQKEFMEGWFTLMDVGFMDIRGPTCIKASKLWMEEWQWSAKKLLHVYRTYFRKKFPFKQGAIDTAADEAAVDDEGRTYLHRMMELKVPADLIGARAGYPSIDN
ncbi:hypothetical protein B0J14DRAFT_571163 [Halenospora varia]|nr:hypothetical protein B0J14DRAFT_571163 [Halenospora varia]